MIITQIKKRRKGLAAVYTDEYESEPFILSYEVVKSNLREGSNITEEELERLKELSESLRAKEKALYLLEYRSHSKKELESKLKRNFSSDTAKAAVERMEELGLMDDRTFAENNAKYLTDKKLYSDRLAFYELTSKGISREDAENALSLSETDNSERIVKLIQKKYSALLNGERDEKLYLRAVNALKRLGYNWSEIKEGLSFIGDKFSQEE